MTADHERDFAFLFRTDQGTIPAAVWRRGLAKILAPMLVLSLIWLALEPIATRSLAASAASGASMALTSFAFVYLIFYAFAVILAAVCFYNLSAKRFRARGRPGALAGLLPFGLLMTGAADWLAPRSEGYVSIAVPIGLAALTAAIGLWTLADCGLARDAGESGK